jgi:hypothetical protein
LEHLDIITNSSIRITHWGILGSSMMYVYWTAKSGPIFLMQKQLQILYIIWNNSNRHDRSVEILRLETSGMLEHSFDKHRHNIEQVILKEHYHELNIGLIIDRYQRNLLIVEVETFYELHLVCEVALLKYVHK